MSELIETIRIACLNEEIDLTLGKPAFNPNFYLDSQEVRRGEAVPITFRDIYPQSLSEIGFANLRGAGLEASIDEVAEASLIYNSGRLRLANARLRARGLIATDWLPSADDYLALARDITDIIRLGAREVLRLGNLRVSTEVPLVVGPQYVKEFYTRAEIGTARRDNGGRIDKKFIDDLYTYTKIAHGLQSEG